MRPRKTHSRPTDAEVEILNILWKTGPATVRRVHEEISETKQSQYTTTLKLMQIMVAKGQLHRDESERSHVYVPAVEREHSQRQMATDLMERAFAGSLRSLVVGALGGRRATKRELAELRALIEEHEGGVHGGADQKGRNR
jgi:BlaI family transcriptional regulator, penicillinase repressor